MDSDHTVFCGNLSNETTEEILYELFLQVAPLKEVRIPTDNRGRKSNFGFVSFVHECSVPYAVRLLDGIELYGRCMSVRPKKKPIENGTPPNSTPIAARIEPFLQFSAEGNGYQFNNFNMKLGFPFQAYNNIPPALNYNNLLNTNLLAPSPLFEPSNVHHGIINNSNYNYPITDCDNSNDRKTPRKDYKQRNNQREFNNDKKRKRNLSNSDINKSPRKVHNRGNNDGNNDSFRIRSRLDQFGPKRKHNRKKRIY